MCQLMLITLFCHSYYYMYLLYIFVSLYIQLEIMTEIVIVTKDEKD